MAAKPATCNCPFKWHDKVCSGPIQHVCLYLASTCSFWPSQMDVDTDPHVSVFIQHYLLRDATVSVLRALPRHHALGYHMVHFM